MLTLHVEAPTHRELVRQAARSLGLVLNEAAVGPEPAQEITGTAPTLPPVPVEIVEPERRKPGRKPRNPEKATDVAAMPIQSVAQAQEPNPAPAESPVPAPPTDTPVKTDPPAEAPAQNQPSGQSPAQAPTLEQVRAAGQKVMDKHGIKRVTEIVLKETGMTRMSAAHAAGHGAKIIAAFEQAVAA